MGFRETVCRQGDVLIDTVFIAVCQSSCLPMLMYSNEKRQPLFRKMRLVSKLAWH